MNFTPFSLMSFRTSAGDMEILRLVLSLKFVSLPALSAVRAAVLPH
jgi:hypothetical protein